MPLFDANGQELAQGSAAYFAAFEARLEALEEKAGIQVEKPAPPETPEQKIARLEAQLQQYQQPQQQQAQPAQAGSGQTQLGQ